jgi:dTDP-4-dehydrorhamnose 3,5-epimerase
MTIVHSTKSTKETEAIRLAFPPVEPGIGKVITSPASKDLIAGVVIEPVAIWPDDRGLFFEVARVGKGMIAGFSPDTLQVSATFTYPGSIKAFHYHLNQTDCWVPTLGMLQVALVDLRDGSSTVGEKNTLYVGVHRPWRILIPPGIAHGYKVIGDTLAGVIYVTNRFYDPDDEGRIKYDDVRINYDWTLQNK